MIVDRGDHVQYLTVSKSYSDNCICSLTEENTILKNLYYCLIQIKQMVNRNQQIGDALHLVVWMCDSCIYLHGTSAQSLLTFMRRYDLNRIELKQLLPFYVSNN